MGHKRAIKGVDRVAKWIGFLLYCGHAQSEPLRTRRYVLERRGGSVTAIKHEKSTRKPSSKHMLYNVRCASGLGPQSERTSAQSTSSIGQDVSEPAETCSSPDRSAQQTSHISSSTSFRLVHTEHCHPTWGL